MMDELLKEIAPLVAAETERASKQYGDKYASAHEAESVLRQENSSRRYGASCISSGNDDDIV